MTKPLKNRSKNKLKLKSRSKQIKYKSSTKLPLLTVEQQSKLNDQKNNIQQLLKRIDRRALILFSAFAIIGATIFIVSMALTPTADFEAESGTRNGSSLVSDGTASGGQSIRFGPVAGGGGIGSTVDRFFADDASWNKTVSQMGGEFTELKPFAERLYDYGGGVGNGASPPLIKVNMKDYSTPIYDYTTRDTSKTYRVFQPVWAQNQLRLSRSGVSIGDTIPYSPSWLPGTGNDKIMHVVDYATGLAYEYWHVGEDKNQCNDANPLGIAAFDGPNTKAGFNASNPAHLCMATVESYNNLWTAKDGSTVVGRGMGINNLALVVRAEEVATGNIRHAIPLTVSNAMFGPSMVSPQYDPLQPEAGFTKGFYMKPATRLEHISGTTLANGPNGTNDLSDAMRAKTVPSGMRFAINVTDGEIISWATGKGYTGAKLATAITFAKAWRDYGGIVAETGRYGIGIETDGVIGPAKQKWSDLGMYSISTDTAGTINFDGLITRDNIYVVKPPQ